MRKWEGRAKQYRCDHRCDLETVTKRKEFPEWASVQTCTIQEPLTLHSPMPPSTPPSTPQTHNGNINRPRLCTRRRLHYVATSTSESISLFRCFRWSTPLHSSTPLSSHSRVSALESKCSMHLRRYETRAQESISTLYNSPFCLDSVVLRRKSWSN